MAPTVAPQARSFAAGPPVAPPAPRVAAFLTPAATFRRAASVAPTRSAGSPVPARVAAIALTYAREGRAVSTIRAGLRDNVEQRRFAPARVELPRAPDRAPRRAAP